MVPLQKDPSVCDCAESECEGAGVRYALTRLSLRVEARRTMATAKKSAKRKSSSRKGSTKKSTAKRSSNPSSTGHGEAKKAPAKQTSQCWPGYKPVAGKARGTKGSCEPKAHPTSSEKKSDSMAASANKLRKAGGSKA